MTNISGHPLHGNTESFRPPLTSGIAVTGLILALTLPLFGIIVSALASRDIDNGNRTGRGIAEWGVVFGIIGIIIPLVILAFSFFGFLNWLPAFSPAAN